MDPKDTPDLKTWLTVKLRPLCDADPLALAKYVFALIRKDKPTRSYPWAGDTKFCIRVLRAGEWRRGFERGSLKGLEKKKILWANLQ